MGVRGPCLYTTFGVVRTRAGTEVMSSEISMLKEAMAGALELRPSRRRPLSEMVSAFDHGDELWSLPSISPSFSEIGPANGDSLSIWHSSAGTKTSVSFVPMFTTGRSLACFNVTLNSAVLVRRFHHRKREVTHFSGSIPQLSLDSLSTSRRMLPPMQRLGQTP